jgi:hypothetical protein
VPCFSKVSIAWNYWGADAEAGFTFAPELNRTSERLLEDSAQLPGSFFERQRFFHDLKLRRLRVLQSEVPPFLGPKHYIRHLDFFHHPMLLSSWGP